MKTLHRMRTLPVLAFVFLASFAGQCGSNESEDCLTCPDPGDPVEVSADLLLTESQASQVDEPRTTWETWIDGSVRAVWSSSLSRSGTEGDRVVLSSTKTNPPATDSTLVRLVIKFKGVDLQTLSGRLVASQGEIDIQRFAFDTADLSDDGTLTVCWQTRFREC